MPIQTEFRMCDTSNGKVTYQGREYDDSFLIEAIETQRFRVENMEAAIEGVTDRLPLNTMNLRKTIIEQSLDNNYQVLEELYEV